jgi:hypothetical protein
VQRDAILFSVSANAQHGQRRTNEDKRRAVMRLLEDPEWCKWSNYKIAARCGVSEFLVRRIKDDEPLSAVEPQIDEPRLVTRNGTAYGMNTANIGSAPAPIYPEPQPTAFSLLIAMHVAYGIRDLTNKARATRLALSLFLP